MSAALRRLEGRGYTVSFAAVDNWLQGGDVSGPPGDFTIDEVVRFEGDTDPADEAAVFALTHAATGVKGSYVITYGPNIDPDDVAIISGLG